MIPDTVTADRMVLRGGSLTVLAGVLWAISGFWGVGIAVLVGLLWVVVSTAYIVAAGQVLYAVFLADPGLAGALATGAFIVLFVPGLVSQWRPETSMVATAVLGLTTAALASSLVVGSVSLAAVVMCLGFGVAAYTIHRYELVRFGLVEQGQ